VVCLQELKAPNEKFPQAAIRKAGYNAIWSGQKSWNGVAILSRKLEMQEVRRTLPGAPADNQSRYLEAIIDNKMLLACIYLPNGNPVPGLKFDYKLKWFSRLTTHAAKLLKADVPVILAGDYNVMPTELDVYKPERYIDNALFRPEARKAFSKLTGQGWKDAIRVLHPKEKIYTFWDYLHNAYERDAGLRLDHFLLSKHFDKRLKNSGVDRHVRGWEKTSDHAPAWIELATDS
jgi:exodeoxyribonuclease-3